MTLETGTRPCVACEEHCHANAQGRALTCMSRALEHLDSDARISPIIGAHLQLAIDRLRDNLPNGTDSIDFC